MAGADYGPVVLTASNNFLSLAFILEARWWVQEEVSAPRSNAMIDRPIDDAFNDSKREDDRVRARQCQASHNVEEICDAVVCFVPMKSSFVGFHSKCER